MDRVTEYGAAVKKILLEYAAFKPSYGEVEVETVFDEEHNHYELAWIGWEDYHRVHGPIIQFDIRGGKVWIQHDGTERGIANELVEAGVPRERIVLAFQHPDKRRHTSFAVS